MKRTDHPGSKTDEEWAEERQRAVCRARPTRRSTARCEMPKGHDPDGPFKAELPVEQQHRAAFHGGRTPGGHWKSWPVRPEERG